MMISCIDFCSRYFFTFIMSLIVELVMEVFTFIILLPVVLSILNSFYFTKEIYIYVHELVIQHAMKGNR